MIGWLIFGGIVLLIAILLALSATVVIDIEKGISVEIKYFLFKIFVFPESEKKKKRREKKEKKKAARERKKQEKLKKKQDKLRKKAAKKNKAKKKSKETPPSVSEDKVAKPDSTAEKAEKSEEKPNSDKKQGEDKAEDKPKAKIDFATIKGMIDSASPPVKRLLKKIRVNDVYIDIVVGGEDSAKVALAYGSMYAVICPVIEWLKSVITFKVEELNIEADFEKEKTDYFVHAKAKLRISTALSCGIWLLFRYFRFVMKNQSASSKPTKPKNRRK